MTNLDKGKEAIVIVDMQKDNVGRFCAQIIPKISLLIEKARGRSMPIIYALDSRYRDDPLFKRLGIPTHTIRGTEGAKVTDELKPHHEDILVEKRMLSAFFGTDLDLTLRQKGISKLIITGIRTEACLLKTVLDAFELGYEVVVPRTHAPPPHRRITKQP